MSSSEIQGNAIIYTYPTGDMDILCASDRQFRADGYEPSEGKFVKDSRKCPAPTPREAGVKSSGEDMQRSARRARSKLRRLALSNRFRWFVTLTLDRERIDRYDPDVVQRALSAWCSNMVQRRGLTYILVPELHALEEGMTDRAYHFHGLFTDSVEYVDSGTIKRPGIKKPRRPACEAQRAEWLAQGGHVVYNLPQWRYGFSTALELYGEYSHAVAYVCKYIGKQDGERPLGRWYYSGGQLAKPDKMIATLDYRQTAEDFAGDAVEFAVPGSKLLVVHTRPADERKDG